MDKLDALKGYSLTNFDLLKMLDNNIHIMTYPELVECKTIDEALAPHDALILLYESKSHYGHWCAIIKRDNTIEHFDSYGIMPDEELKFATNAFRKSNKMRLPHLTALLIECPYRIEFNEFQLQEKKQGVNTCGRWAGLRVLHKDMPIEEFAEYFMNQGMKPDDVATLLTSDIFY